MNWSPHNIFDARGKTIIAKDRTMHLVELYAGGWTIGKHERMDVWAACHLLNDLGARVA